ncbi:MAG: glutathione S-transferase family protein [Hyphomonadaceae bacterium]
MLTLFHSPRSRSMRVLWLCEEMGVPYEVKPASFFEPTPEFLDANPMRTIPAFKDGDVRMTESIAIMMYVMEKYGPTELAVKPQEAGYADYLQYMVFSEATAAAPANSLIAARFLAKDGAGENWTSGYIAEALGKRAAFLENRLKEREHIAADRFTAADIAIAYSIGLLGFVGVSGGEASKAYHERMTARPAYQRAAAIA